ncbi:MAG: OmpP1/FadL family transporter, partial [Bradymonadaceae bacterium]
GRYLLIESSLIQFYATGGAGYRIELGSGTLSAGASIAYTYQENDFSLAIDANIQPGSPYEEKPENDAIFRAKDLSSHKILGILGVAYETDEFRVAASYRPPLHWESEGTAEVDFPDKLSDLGPGLSDDRVTFRGSQAGSLRVGWAWESGTHPGRQHRPRYMFEVNGVWENWSAVDNFQMKPHGNLTSSELPNDTLPDLQSIVQPKNWQDSFSLRLGGSWGATSWLTLHGGGMLETAAQPNSYTHTA